jgi:hypothetical protein
MSPEEKCERGRRVWESDKMKSKPSRAIERFRIIKGAMASTELYGNNGAFMIKYKSRTYKVVISDQLGWDHVSVSLPNRIPTWKEMCIIKDIFFEDTEIVVQYHPAKENYINDSEYVLHMWRCQDKPMPMPPLMFV